MISISSRQKGEIQEIQKEEIQEIQQIQEFSCPLILRFLSKRYKFLSVVLTNLKISKCFLRGYFRFRPHNCVTCMFSILTSNTEYDPGSVEVKFFWLLI